MKLPIPNDWNESQNGYCLLVACIPNSPKWRAIYSGKFYELTWYYVWDKETGWINDAKAISNQVYRSICMANCDDLVLALNRIAAALEGDPELGGGLVDLSTKLEEILQRIDQLEQINNNAVTVLGGQSVNVSP